MKKIHFLGRTLLAVLRPPADYPGLSLRLTSIARNSRDLVLGTKVIAAILSMAVQIACRNEGDKEVAT